MELFRGEDISLIQLLNLLLKKSFIKESNFKLAKKFNPQDVVSLEKSRNLFQWDENILEKVTLQSLSETSLEFNSWINKFGHQRIPIGVIRSIIIRMTCSFSILELIHHVKWQMTILSYVSSYLILPNSWLSVQNSSKIF